MTEPATFTGTLGILQRILPRYRVPVFNELATRCQGGLSVFAGEPRPNEANPVAEDLEVATYVKARNRHLFRRPFYLCWQSGWQAWLAEYEPDALIVAANPRCPATRLVVKAMRKRDRPVLGWGLGTLQLSSGFQGLRRSIAGGFLRSLDGVIAYSEIAAEQYIREHRIPADRVFVAHNAAAKRPTNEAPHRGPLGTETGNPIKVVSVGRLLPGKRIDLLLNACAQLPAALQPDLEIVGDGPVRGELEELAAQVYPRARFVGSKFGAELGERFKAADLFVMPGLGGLAIQEAMSYALPVIVAGADGTQEDLVRPDNGWSIEPGKLDVLIDTLKTALTDPDLRAKGLVSYRIVSEEINIEHMVDSMVNAVNTTVTRYRAN